MPKLHKPIKLLSSQPVKKSKVNGILATFMRHFPNLTADAAKVLFPPRCSLFLNTYIVADERFLVYVANGLAIFFEIDFDVYLPTVCSPLGRKVPQSSQQSSDLLRSSRSGNCPTYFPQSRPGNQSSRRYKTALT